MTDTAFDPYYEWLGIPPKEQPPNHYRLLGIAVYEENGRVIENAADRIVAQLRTYQAGKHSAESQKLLNEVTKAKICLLKPEKKAAYDEQLREALASEQSTQGDELAEVASLVEGLVTVEQRTPARPVRSSKLPGVFAAIAVIVLTAAGAAWFLFSGGKHEQPVAQQASAPPAAEKPAPDAVPPEAKPAPADQPAELAIQWPLEERDGAALEIDNQITDLATATADPATPGRIKLRLAAGRHTFRLSRAGYESFLGVTQLEAGRTQQIQPTWQARPATADGHGLAAVLYEGEDFDLPVKERIDRRVDWLWGFAPPERDFRNDDFSMRWTGWLKAPAAGNYELMALASHGVRVWLDDQQVIDGWKNCWCKPQRVKVELSGKPQALRIDYHAAKGTSLVTLRWTIPGSAAETPIPPEALFYDRAVAERTAVEVAPERPLWQTVEERPLNGLLAEFFVGTNFDHSVATRVDRRLDWLWAFGAPHPSLPNDGFSIRWTGTLRPPRPGEYHLITVSDDGCRLHFDGRVLINDWRDHHFTRIDRKVRLEDRPYELKVEYYSRTGPDFFSLRWIPPDETEDVPIPDTALVPAGVSASPGTTPSPAGTVAERTMPDATPAAATPASTEAAKSAVPAEAALERARGLAQELFKQEYEQAATAEAKQALAAKILEKAAGTDVAVEERYVLLRLARDVALAGDGISAAMEAVDKTAERFTIDAWAEKIEILTKIVRRTRSVEQHKTLAPKILEVLDQALADGADAPAKELLQLAQSESARMRSKDYVQQLRSRKEAVEECARSAADLAAAREALARNPNDPQAKLAMGQWRCFARGEWQVGLPLLAQGGDADLKALAEKELAPTPPAGEEAEKLADAWWERASHASRQQKEQLTRHAAVWYHRALEGNVSAESRARIEKRLSATKNLAGRKAAPPAAVAPFDAQQARRHQQAWAEHLAIPLETTNSIGMKFALIPPGQFTMGATAEEVQAMTEWGQKTNKRGRFFESFASEQPQHTVRITRPFLLGMHEVTQADFQKVMGGNPSAYSATGRNSDRVGGRDTSRWPVEMISWNDAVQFCQRLSALPAELAAKRTYRLPTEAEWEYACRAGTTTPWFCGKEEAALGRYAWFAFNAAGTPHEVGTKEPNAWGLCDMHGNVAEWCFDFWSKNYNAQSPQTDPAGPPQGMQHVRRGGNWTPPLLCRSSLRWMDSPDMRNNSSGVRVALTVP